MHPWLMWSQIAIISLHFCVQKLFTVSNHKQIKFMISGVTKSEIPISGFPAADLRPSRGAPLREENSFVFARDFLSRRAREGLRVPAGNFESRISDFVTPEIINLICS